MTQSDIGALVARSAWATRRSNRATGRRWARAELAQLRGLVGKRSLSAIARELGRPRNSVASKLMQLGYRIKADVQQQIGINCRGLAERTHASYEQVWRDCRAGIILGAFKEAGKDYMIPWRGVRAYERRLAEIRRKRERVLARIERAGVETITKQEFMACVGLGETHATRYLQGKVVKAWKVPLMWVPGKPWRWEWLISKADAERVRHLRATGKLHVRLRKKAYRAVSKRDNDQVKRLKAERRAGIRQASTKAFGPRAMAVVPGYLTIPQVAQRVGLSGTVVYGHAQTSRLAATSVRVGRRTFLAVSPEALAAYETWVRLPLKDRGRASPYSQAARRVHACGRITLREAAAEFGVEQGTLGQACFDGRLKCRKFGNLRGVIAEDVKRYAAGIKRR